MVLTEGSQTGGLLSCPSQGLYLGIGQKLKRAKREVTGFVWKIGEHHALPAKRTHSCNPLQDFSHRPCVPDKALLFGSCRNRDIVVVYYVSLSNLRSSFEP